MKVTGIISAFVFAHVAIGQASDSTSTSVSGTKSASSTKTGTKSSATSTPAATPTGSTGSGDSLSQSSTDLLIPTGISDACSAFLTSLNSDTTVSGCFTSLNNALSVSGSTSKTLASLCSSDSCRSSVMRTKLTDFKDACSGDFTNDIVANQYDVWYSLIPFKSAICSQDIDNTYCLTKIASSSSTTSKTRRSDDSSHLAIPINKRAQTVLTPDLDAFRTQNIPYLGISPDMNNGELCTSCAQQILSKYVAWESATPHALGVSKSPFLGGQSALWAAMQNKCADGFTTQITNIAGVASADQLADGAVTTTTSYFTALAAAFAAAFALF